MSLCCSPPVTSPHHPPNPSFFTPCFLPPPPSASILIQPTSRGHILAVKVSGWKLLTFISQSQQGSFKHPPHPPRKTEPALAGVRRVNLGRQTFGASDGLMIFCLTNVSQRPEHLIYTTINSLLPYSYTHTHTHTEGRNTCRERGGASKAAPCSHPGVLEGRNPKSPTTHLTHTHTGNAAVPGWAVCHRTAGSEGGGW